MRLPIGVSITPDGRYYIRYRPGRNTLEPARTKEYFGRGPEALSRAVARLALLGDRRKLLKPAGPSFSELANQYMQARVHDMSETGAANWYWRMRGLIFPFFGRLSAAQIGHDLLDRYRHERTVAGVKQVTIHKEISYIRAILNWAVRRQLLATNPMAGYEMPRDDSTKIRPMKDEDFQRILDAAAPHLQRALLIAANTGLRPGRSELFSLKWSAFDEKHGTLSITSARKGGLDSREVPLLPDFCKQMAEWRDADGGEGWIIHYGNGPVKKLVTCWNNAVRRAGVTGPVRLYSIRHRFVTRLLDAGADLKAVSELVGHKDVRMTIKVYQESSSLAKRKAISLLGTSVPQAASPDPVKTSK